MKNPDFPEAFLKRLESITQKRARVVIDHILQHGYITTEELKQDYGYDHPPRAARDVRDHGIPLETFKIRNAQGRMIAAYRFGDLTRLRRLTGRKAISKRLKRALIQQNEARCQICQTVFDPPALQIDHRVPYEITGDPVESERHLEELMLLCGSCNRAKSWSCEHCVNWLETKDPTVCQSCYWAYPDSYRHIALRFIRRLDVVWTEREVETYERLRQRSQASHEPMPEFVKAILKKHLED